jgi:hypothetical protein
VLPAAVDWNAPRIIESGKSERQFSAEEAEPVFSIPNLFRWSPGRTGEEPVDDVVGRGTAAGKDGPIAPAPRLVTVESAPEAHDRSAARRPAVGEGRGEEGRAWGGV